MFKSRRENPEFLVIGKIIKAHGMKGFVEAKSLTDFPERFKPGLRVYASDFDLSETGFDYKFSKQSDTQGYLKSSVTRLRLEKVGAKGNNLLLKFQEVKNRREAENYKGHFLQVPITEAVSLPENAYWYHQIEGLKVATASGEIIGEITGILKTGSNDIYVVSRGRDKKEVLIPATKEVVKKVDLKNQRMVIEPLPGLLD